MDHARKVQGREKWVRRRLSGGRRLRGWRLCLEGPGRLVNCSSLLSNSRELVLTSTQLPSLPDGAAADGATFSISDTVKYDGSALTKGPTRGLLKVLMGSRSIVRGISAFRGVCANDAPGDVTRREGESSSTGTTRFTATGIGKVGSSKMNTRDVQRSL